MKKFTTADTIYFWGDAKVLGSVLYKHFNLVLSMAIEQNKNAHVEDREVLRDAILEICNGHTNEQSTLIHGQGGHGAFRLTKKGRIQIGSRDADTGDLKWRMHPAIAEQLKELRKRLRKAEKEDFYKCQRTGFTRLLRSELAAIEDKT